MREGHGVPGSVTWEDKGPKLLRTGHGMALLTR